MADTQEMLDATRAKVREYVRALYPDCTEFEGGQFIVQEGSATVSIIVREWHEGDTAVEFTSQLVTGANITPELMRWLLEKNVEIHFGAFGLLFDDTIVYSQTLPGCDLSKEEFESTARTVATIADHYDDQIVAKAGGTTGAAAAVEVAKELESA